MKQLICAADVEALKQSGKTVCVVGADTIVTPSARDAAEALRVSFADRQPEPQLSTGCSGQDLDSEKIYRVLKALMGKQRLAGKVF